MTTDLTPKWVYKVSTVVWRHISDDLNTTIASDAFVKLIKWQCKLLHNKYQLKLPFEYVLYEILCIINVYSCNALFENKIRIDKKIHPMAPVYSLFRQHLSSKKYPKLYCFIIAERIAPSDCYNMEINCKNIQSMTDEFFDHIMLHFKMKSSNLTQSLLHKWNLIDWSLSTITGYSDIEFLFTSYNELIRYSPMNCKHDFQCFSLLFKYQSSFSIYRKYAWGSICVALFNFFYNGENDSQNLICDKYKERMSNKLCFIKKSIDQSLLWDGDINFMDLLHLHSSFWIAMHGICCKNKDIDVNNIHNNDTKLCQATKNFKNLLLNSNHAEQDNLSFFYLSEQWVSILFGLNFEEVSIQDKFNEFCCSIWNKAKAHDHYTQNKYLQPLSSLLKNENNLQIIENIIMLKECNWYKCQNKHKTLKRCKQCKSVYYCCKLCQKKDWISNHRNTCTNLNRRQLSMTLQNDHQEYH